MADKRFKTDKDPSLYHVPPQSIEAEESILSAVLIDNEALIDILEKLSPADFYSILNSFSSRVSEHCFLLKIARCNFVQLISKFYIPLIHCDMKT